LDGIEYKLAKNNNNNSLHGGIKGFDKAWWNAEQQENDGSLKLTYQSIDGEEGFPGNLNVEIVYKLFPDNALLIDFTATTDKATPVNLTSHCYFNLSAGKTKTVLDHELLLFADEYTILDNNSIPTGEIASVNNTAYDFTHPKKIGADINNLPNGYDINMVLSGSYGKAAILYEPITGRYMEMFTTEPGLQFYSGNFLADPTNKEQSEKHAAVCLEAQHFPNSPNEPSFPSTILRPGNIYRQSTVYKFSAK